MEKNAIPPHLLLNREWGALLHLFLNCPKLQRYLTTEYFDFNRESVGVAKLKRLSRPWSQSERFMLALALHCYNALHKSPDLGVMGYLDETNRRLVFEALQIRYGKGVI